MSCKERSSPANRAARLLDLEERRAPELVKLLRPLSLALRAELELVRAMRLALFPTFDPGLEADLWSSPVLQAADVSAVVLLPEVRTALQAQLKREPALLKAAWEIVVEHHENLDEVILLQERVTYHALLDDLATAQAQLGRVYESLHATPQDRQLLRWTKRLLPHLPESVKGTEAAMKVRGEVARQTGEDPPCGIPKLSADEAPEDVLADAETVTLGIRRVPEGVWITAPPEPKSIEFEAPLTEPVRLFFDYPTAEGWEEEVVDLDLNAEERSALEPRFVSAPVGQLRVRTVAQREGRLRFQGERPLLYVLLDGGSERLPSSLEHELEDLGWRREVARLSSPEQRVAPKVVIVEKLFRDYPLDGVISLLTELGFEISHFDRPSGVSHSIEIREAEKTAQAALLIFEANSFGQPWFLDTAGLFLQRQARDKDFVFIPVPTNQAAMERLAEHDLKERFLLETKITTSESPEEQLRQIRASLAKVAGEHGPADWRSGSRAGNYEAAATLLLFEGVGRLMEYTVFLDQDDYPLRDDLNYAISHNQPILLSQPRQDGDHMLTEQLSLSGQSGPVEAIAQRLRRALLHSAFLRPDRTARGSNLRGALLEAERTLDQKRIAQFLASRFEITDEEKREIDSARVLIEGRNGFMVTEDLAIVPATERDFAPTAEAIWGETSLPATLVRQGGDLALYQIERNEDGPRFLPLDEAPVEREDRWTSFLPGKNGRSGGHVAGVVRQPYSDEAPGAPHVLACAHAGHFFQGVSGPMVHRGKLVGMITSVVEGADFGGEGDLAYASDVEDLVHLLQPPQRFEFVEWKEYLPEGVWGPPNLAILEVAPETSIPVGEARWGVATPDGSQFQLLYTRTFSEQSGRSAHRIQIFPPNNCTKILTKLEAIGRSPIETPIEPLLRSKVMIPASDLALLEEFRESIIDPPGPIVPGLRWRIAGYERDDKDPENPDGHAGTVRSLALSPSGVFAITAGNSEPDRTVKLWHLHTGQLMHTLENQALGGGQTAVALSADGTRALTSYEHDLRLWDAERGEQVGEWSLKFSNSFVRDAAFAGDHHLLATSEEQAALIEVKSGHIEPLGTGSGQHLAVAATEHGDLFAVLREDGLTIWKNKRGHLEIIDQIVETGSPMNDHLHFQRPPLRFTLDGSLFFGSPLVTWTERLGVQRSEGQSLANVADYDWLGAALWATSPGSTQVIDRDGKPLSPELQCGGRQISCAAISGDGSTVLATDYDHHLWVWWLGDRSTSAL